MDLIRVAVILTVLLNLTYCQQPEVQVLTGSIVGQTKTSRDGRLYYSYTSIPYAKPPIGKYRFMVGLFKKYNTVKNPSIHD